MTMLRSCYQRCFGRLGAGDELFWCQDLKPHASGEFSIAVAQANSTLEDQGQVVSTPFATFIGVYDGHGGPDAARFVNAQLFPHFRKFALEHKGVSADVIRKAFAATEEEFLNFVKCAFPSKPRIASVGSCCLVGVIEEGMLHVANLGDSRAVLGRWATPEGKEVVAERLTSDHNVADVEIRKELRKLHPDESDIVVHTRGVWRIKGIIQVSRSIGDAYLKKPEFSRDPLFPQFIFPSATPLKRSVISAEPSVHSRKLNPDDLFLIFASDGFWEQLTDEAAVEIVSKHPRSGIAKRLVRAALEEAAKKVEMRYNDMKRILKGVRRHFHDDITVIVVYLDHNYGNASSPNFKAENCNSVNTPADVFSLHSHEFGSRRLRPEP